ncbi:MAG TPA: branched-chain amino acid ABC transporter permease [Gammaproteobacteria bacterium]|jgi:branched-chain amino acid transport system permease protein|nr:branched-chain amino acid ABC transporter permease [Arenicellales bacterium]MDP6854568.1 branched-chain amino acid ABC transporter permease [Arenicellales bacterium]HCY13032.1 branched-chain amino acid ABC transporter permease [Gammaproteobacteria bacterium]|tara:strand:+ start:2851 stop:3702 length:852 start_codon:yes stop_codon:yes gene_type:complete
MAQVIIQGFLLSGLYALIAVGFTMIFSVGRVLNLAYGVYIMLGGYVYYVAVQILSLPKFPSFLLAGLAGIVFGVLTYLVLVKRFEKDPIAVEISTLILAVVMQAVIVLIFSTAPRSMWPLIPGRFEVFGVSILKNILFATAVSWVVLGSLMVFIHKTHIGRAIRAVSMDAKGAAVSGIDPQRINLVTWALSGVLGAIAGVFFATYTQLDPGMWVFPLITAVAVVIVGGIGSIIGSLIAAHIIGFMEVATTTWISADLRGVFTMALIIVVLVVAPKGLLGKAEL